MKNNRHLFTYAVECIATIEVETDKDWDKLSDNERQNMIDKMTDAVANFGEQNMSRITDNGELEGDNITYQGVTDGLLAPIQIKLKDWE
jgi:hypothetical protein